MRRRRFVLALAAVALFGPRPGLTPAVAAPVTWTFAGSITSAEPGNALGLSPGDPITGHATFDQTLVPLAAPFFLAVDEDPAFELAFSVGGFSFTAFDDIDYGSGYPVLAFDAGMLVGVEFLGDFPPPNDALAFDVVGADVLITDDGDAFREVARGAISRFDAPSIVSVAEPATFPLVLFAWPAIEAIRRRLAPRTLGFLLALTAGLTALPGAPVYAQGVPIRLLTCPAGQVPVSVGTGWVCGNQPAGAAAGDRLVFVTSQLYTGDLDGVGGANEKCQARAIAAGLPGTYRAWVSSNASAPDSGFAPGALTYRLVDGTLVASGWGDLTTEKQVPTEHFLKAPIDRDEFGVPVSGELRVWTGTSVKGTGGFAHCGPYGVPWGTSSGAATGFYGRSDADGANWTEFSTTSCSTPLRLYCFQQ